MLPFREHRIDDQSPPAPAAGQIHSGDLLLLPPRSGVIVQFGHCGT
jgi:hypothetical protein